MTKIFLWHFFLPQFCFRLRSQQIILWWSLVQCLYVMTIFFSSLSVCYQRWMLYSEICGCRRGRSSGSCSRHQFKVHHSVSCLWYYTIYITIKRLIFMVHACKFEKKIVILRDHLYLRNQLKVVTVLFYVIHGSDGVHV